MTAYFSNSLLFLILNNLPVHNVKPEKIEEYEKIW